MGKSKYELVWLRMMNVMQAFLKPIYLASQTWRVDPTSYSTQFLLSCIRDVATFSMISLL